jgi:putative ABC transport system ATP-binding protein
MSRAVELRNVVKVYELGEGINVEALRGVDLNVEKGEMLSIMGPSGSGKSTLLNMIGGLDNPTSGRVMVDGIDITEMGEGELAHFRRESVGFVFQFFNLIPILTALENVELPMIFEGNLSSKEIRERASDLLRLVGLGERMDHRPNQLSGGEQQRIAIARALVNEPSIVIADELTGNVDREAGLRILRFIQNLNKTLGQTFILVTHDPIVCQASQRILYMSDGRITSEPPKLTVAPSEQVLSEERRQLMLTELGWLRNSLVGLEESRGSMKTELYNQLKAKYAKKLESLKQAIRS